MSLTVAQLIESDGPGGAERVVADLAIGLQSAGARSVVFLPANGEGWLARQLSGSDVKIEYYRLDSPLSPACARSLAAAFRRHGVSIAHSHEFSMAVHGAWSSWLAGVPHVITMHGGRYYANRLRRRLALGAAIAFSARAVAVSNQLADDLSHDVQEPRSRIAMILNGVRYTPVERPTLRDELGLEPGDSLIVSVGNLYPVKGHCHLIDAVASLSRSRPRLHLAIGGRGDLADSLAAQARGHGLADRVHLLGLRGDVNAVLAAADLFVLPSLSEGLPLALLEAMFAGCPIVASDVGEVRTVLANGDAGILVAPGNVEQLAGAIDRLISNRAFATALGERAARRALREYDVSRMVTRYGDLYREVLQPAAAPPYRGLSLKPPERAGE